MLHIHSFCFNPFQENTYVLYNDQKEAIIIDPGMYSELEFKQFLQFINKNELSPKLLLNTHCHLDHVFGNNFVSEQFQLTAHFHSNEQIVIDRLPEASAKWGVISEAYKGPVKYINDGEIIPFVNDKLKVLLTPGHSPGSVCFYIAEQEILIGGDLVFMDGVGRTDLPGSNPMDLIKSIRDKILPLPDTTIIFSGHGPETNLSREKRQNPYILHILNS
jgi:glyoxylase-like metal-dependent hydrolase (beta-lactamase superfamily II)